MSGAAGSLFLLWMTVATMTPRGFALERSAQALTPPVTRAACELALTKALGAATAESFVHPLAALVVEAAPGDLVRIKVYTCRRADEVRR